MFVDLSGAKCNKSTKFPEGFDREAAGMVLVEWPISSGCIVLVC
jgi:hypothetical protein